MPVANQIPSEERLPSRDESISEPSDAPGNTPNERGRSADDELNDDDDDLGDDEFDDEESEP